MSSQSRIILTLVSLILLWFSIRAVTTGFANLRYSASELYFSKAEDAENREVKQKNLSLAQLALRKAVAVDAKNSSYHLLGAKTCASLKYLNDDSLSAAHIECEKEHLIKALRNAPTRADAWAEYARVLFETEGASKNTLLALDKALKYGPEERPALMVNAAVTLTYWSQLNAERQKKGWFLMLETMKDVRMAKEINKIAERTGLQKQLQRSMRER